MTESDTPEGAQQVEAHDSMPPPTKGTRRTGGIQTRGRAARVVESVLRAAAEELARVGYGALRIEDVASRSGVNKTTIYRRWPRKADLVAATLDAATVSLAPPDTGSLREDALTMVRDALTLKRSPLGRGIMRMIQSERAEPEVERIFGNMRDRMRASRTFVVERAIARGQLPAGTSAALVAELLFTPILVRHMLMDEQVTDAFVVSAIDLVLQGARSGAGRVNGA
jgi:AcrR family transcriptional regulator